MAKVIFSLLDTPAFGGAEQYLFSHLHFLSQHGYEVVLVTNNLVVRKEILTRLTAADQKKFHVITASYRLDAIGNWKGLVKYFLTMPGAMVWCFLQLWRLRRQYGRVICLFPGWSDRMTFSPLVKLFGLPLIWIEFGPLEPVFQRNWGFPEVLYEFTKDLPDHFITISEWTLQSMVKTGQIPTSKISLIYPGINRWTAQQLHQFQKIGRAEYKKRKLIGYQVIGYIGRLASENQIDVLLRAFAHLKKAKTKLLIIGTGPEKSYYEDLARELGVSAHVHFTGFVDEKLKYSLLSCCDIFVFPGAWEWEGFGMTTIEVMSLGVSVVTPNFGPQKEIIVDGISGLHFQPRDEKDLQEKMRLLLSNAKLRKKIAAEGQKRVEFFEQEKNLRKMYDVINEVESSGE